MKEIPLTRGKFALIDDEDFELIMRHEWKYTSSKNKHEYARSTGRESIRMHSYIMNCPDGKVVDHRDGNGLNNQKNNLRVCSAIQNSYNTRKSKAGRNKFKGVSRRGNKWHTSIGNGKRIFVGSFSTEREAAEAYNKKAKELFGEFYNPNKFDPPTALTAVYGKAI